MRITLVTALILASSVAFAAEAPIDRHALVTRHNIEWNDLRGEIPIGNGEFCFNADATGLQTFGGSTMSHWAWHSAPLPPGCAALDVPVTGTIEHGRITGPMRGASGRGELDGWMFRNPHPINLARLRLVRSNGEALKPDELGKSSIGYDLWTGLHSARYEVDGQLVFPSPQNNYDQRRICTGGPCPYLPGNGGLLYAVAMMAAGWDGGPTSHAPGFPGNGSWVVQREGLKRTP